MPAYMGLHRERKAVGELRELRVFPPLPGAAGASDVGTDTDMGVCCCLAELLEEHRRKADEHHSEILAAVTSILERLGDIQKPERHRTPAHTYAAGAFRAAHSSPSPAADFRQASSSSSGLCWTSSTSAKGSYKHSDSPSRAELLHRSSQRTLQSASGRSLAVRLGVVEKKSTRAEARWRRLVHHRFFDLLVSFLITVSMAFTFVEEQLLGYHANVALGLAEDGRWPAALEGLAAVEHVMNAIFIVEICVRIAADSPRVYFKLKSNWFDLFVVLVGAADNYVLPLLAAQTGQNLSVVRLVRLARVIRTMRAARSLKVLQPLNVLIRTIISSCLSLFWSLVVLGIFQLTAAMMLAQSLHYFIMDDDKDLEARLWVNRMYGSAAKSLYTFFEITFSGGWPAKVRPLVEDVGFHYAIFFMFYITGVVFAIIRIISAMFLKDTLAEAAKDEKSAVQQREEDKTRTAAKIRELFITADTSGDGLVSIDEFREIFHNSKMRTWCELMDLDVSDVDSLFELLDDGDGVLRYSEFVDGMLRLKGPASSRDVLALTRESHQIMAECTQLRELLMELRLPVPRTPITTGVAGSS